MNAHEDEAQRRRIDALTNAVIDEDVFATEEIERILRGLPAPPRDRLVRSDATLVRGRAMLQAAMNGEAAAKARTERLRAVTAS